MAAPVVRLVELLGEIDEDTVLELIISEDFFGDFHAVNERWVDEITAERFGGSPSTED